ncbi:MAG TPA: HTH domain-containing protein, partial [bacterium]|nr:HTH domain-containing protein [bacterium]
ELQRIIIAEIKKRNDINYEELAKILNKGRTTVYRKIKDLADKNVLKRVGSDKSGYWEIIKQ